MKFLRKKFICRVTSILLLINFTQSIFLPYYAHALTSGEHQPEFTSYEESGATDMVNLLTGDFSFTLPIVDVPGPEGGFSMPLSYHAGIGPENEASWVGLGFNLSAGQILRGINQYPDDANGEGNQVTVQNLTGISGYSIQWAGPYYQSWNSIEGKYGDVNLLDFVEVEWGAKTSVGIVGFHFGDGNVSWNYDQTVSAIQNAFWIWAAYGEAATAAEGTVEKGFMAAAKFTASQLYMQSAFSLAKNGFSGSGSTAGYSEYKNSPTHKSLQFSWNPLIGHVGIKRSTKTWLDQTRTEQMYGVLNIGGIPVSQQAPGNSFSLKINGVDQPINLYNIGTNGGPASDIDFTLDGTKEYKNQNFPTLLAADQYQVNAPDISGTIKPYRFEIGSVAMPRKMTSGQIRYALIQYLNDYKVPFIYANSNSNSYFHHVGSQPSTSVTSPTFYYGLDLDGVPQGSNALFPPYTFQLNDQIFSSERIRSDVNSLRKIPMANHVEWLTNLEIKNATNFPSGFMDCLPVDNSSRSNFRNLYPSKGIGGYCITAADGKTYHFALPLYSRNQKSEMVDVTDSNIRTIVERDDPFATTWLLTAITGPDFVDRNQNGLVDDTDWGYWVKLNYGKYTETYDWRMPYGATETTVDPSGKFNAYQSGQKQLYYLNSIETRSHVALFFKSPRQDGKSANGGLVTPLKLDEICLLKKEQANSLKLNFGLDYSNKVDVVCSSSQITSGVRDYINKNCIKRLVFTYDYILCKNTPNASGPNNPNQAKLTLTRLSIRGRNDFKTVPDYIFGYGSNPNYSSYNWDGWGMYSGTGTSLYSSHKTNDPSGVYGSAWSLNKITTPLGSEISINYERDTYSSISGQDIVVSSLAYNNGAYSYSYPNDVPIKKLFVNNNGSLAVGDFVNIDGTVNYKCSYNINYSTQTYSFKSAKVTEVGSNYIKVDSDYMGLCPGGNPGLIDVSSQTGTITKLSKNKSGGGIRVGSIVMSDPFSKQTKVRYIYTNDDGSSSGVVAQEPDYIRDADLDFYKYINYPVTGVLYGKVSVLSGKLTTDSEYDSKQVFEFETPNTSQWIVSAEDKNTNQYTGLYKQFFKIEDRTAKIGKPKSVKIFDAANNLVSSTTLTYSEQIRNNDSNSYQGIFSEGTLLSDNTDNILKLNRTTLLHYPVVLSKVSGNKDGLTSTSENLKWDFITGTVTEKLDKSNLGVYVKSVMKPAYKVYAELGSKAFNVTTPTVVNNKNMLSQIAETYVYRADPLGNALGLISADVQTWSNNWTKYRAYNSQAPILSSPWYDEGTQTYKVWRQGPSYSWIGNYSRRQPDGTQAFTPSDDFNFSSTTNPLWQYNGEVLRFDHYGMPLEIVDQNKGKSSAIYSCTKMGYEDQTVLAKAYNAKFNEIAFSSAEDYMNRNSIPSFGGEVAKDGGVIVTTPVHTGTKALAVSNTLTGFVFKSSEISPSRTYRACVWSNSPNGRLYYKLDGVVQSSANQTISQAVAIPNMGNWYRIDLTITNPACTNFEVGVKSNDGSTVVFDDFRFQPADAIMTGYVYQSLDYEFTSGAPAYTPSCNYELDNDNLFTKYESIMTTAGEQVRVYKESLPYGVKMISETKSNNKRFITNP